jgi:hypothetical protein
MVGVQSIGFPKKQITDEWVCVAEAIKLTCEEALQ